MTLRPLNDCVLIAPEPEGDYLAYKGSDSGLILPEVYAHGPEDRPKWGRIVSFGQACTLNKVCWGSQETKKQQLLHVGDRVLYAKFGWAKVDLWEGKHLALVRELDIIAVDQ